MNEINGQAADCCGTPQLAATSGTSRVRTSRVWHVGLLAAGVVAVAVFALFVRRGGSSDWATEDLFEPPPFPVPVSDANPVLDSAKPLATTRKSGKPVVAADHHGQVVVIAHDIGPSHTVEDECMVQWCSKDGGATWKVSFNKPRLSDEGFFFDPWLVTDRRGRFYWLVGSAGPDKPNSGGLNLFYRSADGGDTWSPRINVTPPGDRPVLGISPNGKLLVAASYSGERLRGASTEILHPNDPNKWDKFWASYRKFSAIVVSEDRGSHWKLLPGPMGDYLACCFSVVVEDDGRIAGSWLANRSAFLPEHTGAATQSLVCSTPDRGQTWTQTVLVEGLQPDVAHPVCAGRFPVLAVDGDRNLHMAFVSALGRGLFVRTSKDWVAWESPIQLSSDQAAEVQLPAIAAWGPMVHVTWMERHDTSWQMYYRGSKDHGRSWSGRVLVSVPNAGSTLIDSKGFEITSNDDQTSVADDGLGNAHIVWCVRARDGNTTGTAWHAIVRWRRRAD